VVFGIKGASKSQFQKVQVRVMDQMPRSNKPIPGGLELRFYHHSETDMQYAKQFLAEEKRREKNKKD
jgi:hypothetical protein